MTAMTVQLNGVKVDDEVEPRQTLADFLRDRCGLTATHLGCEHGACGACTVFVDGIATRSCLTLAVMSDGRTVFTLEGLRGDAVMTLLRRHFHENHALQCGFCTPGMLMTARDILQRHVHPNAETVRHELSGQICRCTGYANIVKAIVAAGQEFVPAAESAPAEHEEHPEP
jgi:carbon-monoxide dehydrogenase small subunit